MFTVLTIMFIVAYFIHRAIAKAKLKAENAEIKKKHPTWRDNKLSESDLRSFFVGAAIVSFIIFMATVVISGGNVKKQEMLIEQYGDAIDKIHIAAGNQKVYGINVGETYARYKESNLIISIAEARSELAAIKKWRHLLVLYFE